MSAPQATVVNPPSPAAAPATAEHISELHQHLDELKVWFASRLDQILRACAKAAPVVEAAAAAVAPVLGAVGAPVVAAVEKAAAIVEGLACCGHTQSQHYITGLCAEPGCSCKGPAK